MTQLSLSFQKRGSAGFLFHSTTQFPHGAALTSQFTTKRHTENHRTDTNHNAQADPNLAQYGRSAHPNSDPPMENNPPPRVNPNTR